MATAYNNEGVKETNLDRSISLFRKALKYDPESRQIKENLAGALYAKGAKLIEGLRYSYEPRSVLSRVLMLLREAHEYNPYSQEILNTHTQVADVLKKLMF